jgi:predicted secreted protein
MPRPPGQSDFEPDYTAPTIAEAPANATATRWVLWITMAMLAALVLLLVIGPHIPSGE